MSLSTFCTFNIFCYAYARVNKREVIMNIVHFVNAAYNF